MSFSFSTKSRELETRAGLRHRARRRSPWPRPATTGRRSTSIPPSLLERHRRRLDAPTGTRCRTSRTTDRAWRGSRHPARRSSAPIRSAATLRRGARRSARRSRPARRRCSSSSTAESHRRRPPTPQGQRRLVLVGGQQGPSARVPTRAARRASASAAVVMRDRPVLEFRRTYASRSCRRSSLPCVRR